MRQCLFFMAMLLSSMPAACSAKDPSALTNMGGLQSSIIRLAKAAPNYSQDEESLWAFGVADSIAKTMTLQRNDEAKDLAAAYKALSYVAYGLNYGTFPLMDEAEEYLTIATACIVDKDDQTCTFCKELHQTELRSDLGFAIFLDPNTHVDMLENFIEEWQETYKNGEEDAFKYHQLQNRFFYFALGQAIVRLVNNDDWETVEEKLEMLAGQLDSMPKSVSTEEEYEETFNKIIGARVKLINLMAMNLEHNKRVWPQQQEIL